MPFFFNFSADYARPLMSSLNNFVGRRCVAERGAHLVTSSSQYKSCLILVKGMLSRQHFLADGRRQIVGLHIPGDVCGLQALYNDRVGYELVALTTATFISVDKYHLMSAAQNSGDLAKALWQAMLREIALADAWTVNLGMRSAYERMAYFGCELETRLRLAGQDTSAGVEWPGTQADFGALMGLSAVHVNRTIRKLVDDKLMSSGRCMKFQDFDKLRAIAGFDPSHLSDHCGSLSDVLLSRLYSVEERERKSLSMTTEQLSP